MPCIPVVQGTAEHIKLIFVESGTETKEYTLTIKEAIQLSVGLSQCFGIVLRLVVENAKALERRSSPTLCVREN